MEYMLEELNLLRRGQRQAQRALGRNYVGGFPNSAKLWSTFREGDFSTYFGAWAPFYNLHKMFADCVTLGSIATTPPGTAIPEILRLGCRHHFGTDRRADGKDARKRTRRHGRGHSRCLRNDRRQRNTSTAARRFAHRQLLIPMEEHRDCLDNMHANTQIPKVVGFQRISELDGDNKMHDASQYFWDIVTSERSLRLGGNSRREHFPTKETCIDYVNDIDGPESCNTYNMLKLTEFLNRANPDGAYGDFYEIAMFNHISRPSIRSMAVMSTSHRPVRVTIATTPLPNMAMWCCVGTGMENHGKYGQFVWTRSKGAKSSDDALYLNLFVASQLNWRDKGMVLRQETAFPMPNHRR